MSLITNERPANLVLGCKAKDKISGFEGIVIAITEWLNGCQRVMIQPQALDAGKPIDAHAFDSEQVIVIEDVVAPAEKKKDGPSIVSTRAKDPARF